MVNAHEEGLTFQIQEGVASAWRRVVITSLENPSHQWLAPYWPGGLYCFHSGVYRGVKTEHEKKDYHRW